MARRAAAIFVFAAIFWAFEIIPLYVTSLWVVILEILVLAQPPERAALGYLKPFASPVIMLFLGSFLLSRAFQKHGLDHKIAILFLSFFGRKPYGVLLGFMSATAFLSMWMSNTAAAALMLAMIIPLRSGLEKNDPFRKALVLGIAFAAAFGGIATPVGTPPNAILFGLLAQRGIRIDFFQWVQAALPLAVLVTLFSSVVLYRFFPPQKTTLDFNFASDGQLKKKQFAVLGIAFLTGVFWLTAGATGIPEGVSALICGAALMGLRLLDSRDFRGIEWDILVLMWGGLALGDGMEASGLAHWLVGLPLFSHQGLLLALIFLVLTVFLSTFMSNTAAVNLIVPLVFSFGGPQAVMLAILVTMASSFDFPLPMSTPPMAMAYGTGELKVREMLRVGAVITVAANVLLMAGLSLFNHGVWVR
ncbi:MAG: hypothetical protein A2Y02_03120 [Omnitrophica bacterium GWA2_52_12]|nr:MAG: hypothetical protein A2Y02_03120 [Omnitrophica bacterium GWA2_52_12]